MSSNSSLPLHLQEPFYSGPIAGHSSEILFYRLGDGPWLERLCFLLMQHKGWEPEYYGRSGQAQHGIDLIGRQSTQIYYVQCKNLSNPPKASDLSNWGRHFIDHGLSGRELEAPCQWIICCPHPLEDTTLSQAKQKLQKELQAYKVELVYWDKHLLDAMLRKTPDIVAEMFGDVVAQSYADKWLLSSWVPVKANSSSHSRLSAYFELLMNNRVWKGDSARSNFIGFLEASRKRKVHVSVLLGASGTGKTCLALDGCQALGWRIFYLQVEGYSGSAHELADSIVQRLSQPTQFILDDVHANYNLVEEAINLAKGATSDYSNKDWHILCIAKHAVPISKGVRGVNSVSETGGLSVANIGGLIFEHKWLNWCRDHKIIFPKVHERRNLIDFILYQRPEWGAIPTEKLDRLCSAFGNNLWLLALACKIMQGCDALNLEVENVLERARQHMLPHPEAYPDWQSFATLSAYDVQPRIKYFNKSQQEALSILANRKDSVSWVYKTGKHPFCYATEHAAAGELLLALAAEPGCDDTPEKLALNLLDYCVWLYKEFKESQEWFGLIEKVSRHHLACKEKEDNDLVKALFLSDLSLRDVWVEQALKTEKEYLLLLAVKVCNEASAGREVEGSYFAKKYVEYIKLQVCSLSKSQDPSWLISLGYGLGILKKCEDHYYADLMMHTPASHWISALLRGTLVEFFKVVENAPIDFARDLILALDSEAVDSLCDWTMPRYERRSISTLHFTWRSLAQIDQEHGSNLQHLLENVFTPRHWGNLLKNTGSIQDLFHILQYASPNFAEQLIAQLSQSVFEQIVQRSEDNSPRTLSFSLQAINKDGHKNHVLQKLIELFTPETWSRLLEKFSVTDFFNITQGLPSSLALKLLRFVDEATGDLLCHNTLEQSVSIASISLTLRTRNEASGLEVEIAYEQERILTPARLISLLEQSSLQDFLNTVQHLSLTYCVNLISLLKLNRSIITRMCENTKTPTRSFSTIPCTLNRLREKNKSIHRELELLIDMDELVDLLIEVASPLSISDTLLSLSDDSRNQCLHYFNAKREGVNWVACAKKSKDAAPLTELSKMNSRLSIWRLFPCWGKQLYKAMENQLPDANWRDLYGLKRCLPEEDQSMAIESLRNKIHGWFMKIPAPQSEELTGEDLSTLPWICPDKRTDIYLSWKNRFLVMYGKREYYKHDPELYAKWAPYAVFWLFRPEFTKGEALSLLLDGLHPSAMSAVVLRNKSQIYQPLIHTFFLLWNSLAAYVEHFDVVTDEKHNWLAMCREFGVWIPMQTQHIVRDTVATYGKGRLASNNYAPVLQMLGLMDLLGWRLPDMPALQWRLPNGRSYSIDKALSDEALKFVPTTLLQLGAQRVMHDKRAFIAPRCDILLQKYHDMCKSSLILPLESVHQLAKWVGYQSRSD